MPPKTRSVPEVESEAFDYKGWFQDHLKPIVGVCGVVLVLGLGLIFFYTLKRQDRQQHWTDFIASTLFASPYESDQVLDHLQDKTEGDLLAHTLYAQAVRFTREKDYDRALEALERLEAEGAESYLTVIPSPNMQLSVPGALRQWIEGEKAWDEEYGYEEPVVDTDRVALVETSKGPFWIGFYSELSAAHVENFVSLAKSGALNGVTVTSITGNYFNLGGEASRDEDPFNDSPEDVTDVLEPGPGRFKARQDRGAISNLAVEGGEARDRFTLVTGSRAFDLEKRQTVFGTVLKDRFPLQASIDEIANAVTYAKSPNEEIKANPEYREIADHPVEPIVIERVTIWTGDAIEEGHSFDTAEVKKPVKEAKPAEDGESDAADEESTPSEDE